MNTKQSFVGCRILFFSIGVFFFFILSAANASAASVSLAWDAVSATNLSGYKVHYGTQSRSYTNVLDTGKNITYTVPNLTEGKTYYFAVTAHNTAGQSSTYSNEVSHFIPTAQGTLTFSDAFNTDTRSGYTLFHTWTQGGKGQFLYDGTGKRLKFLTGDKIGMEIERSLPESDEGVFQFDFLPTKKYSGGGEFYVRLMEDESTFYEIYNTDGLGPGGIEKWVNGTMVASKRFTKGYVQGTTYKVKISYSSTAVVVQGFGETVTLNFSSGDIFVNRFALELRQQDAYLDNLICNAVGGHYTPKANAGTDQTVKEGTNVTLDGSGSTATNATIASYRWLQTGGPTVSFTSSAVKPTFTAPAVTGSSTVLQFKLTVTDSKGVIDTDTVTVTVLDGGSTVLFSDAFNVDSRSQYKVVNTWTQGGTGKFLYDSTGKRLKLLVGDNVGLRFERLLPALKNGTFQISFLPFKKYPNGGEFNLRLLADNNTFYEIYNTDGLGAGGIRKFVAGKKVASANFSSGYGQNKTYNVTVSFSPTDVSVQAFGQTVSLKVGATSAILVDQFTLELKQQDAYIDNITY
jgi:hypothetical protein